MEANLNISTSSFCVTGASCVEKQNLFDSLVTKDIAIVSLELATKVILDERKNDDSEYCEGGIDIGRTVEKYLLEILPKNSSIDFTKCEEVQFCGIESILQRGLKYLSTGEMRRTLLCRAMLQKSKPILLHEPFAGLDIDSYNKLFDYINEVVKNNSRTIMLFVERFSDIPFEINSIVDFCSFENVFSGTRQDYEKLISENFEKVKEQQYLNTLSFKNEFNKIENTPDSITVPNDTAELVRFNNVNVGWGDTKVLRNIQWVLTSGGHTLIQGPNGSGKTTILELITGDNTQVYCNDIWLFGKKRGTGETIWEIKKKIGIVSYKIHVEYKLLGGIDIEAVLLSGFHDSIGLYEARSKHEQSIVKKWLKLGGFEGREKDNFAKLSYCEQRLLLILRAAVKSAPILILDEPCHGLDELSREKVLTLIDSIAERGQSTILHVTHDPTEIRSFETKKIELCPSQSPMYKIIAN